MRACRWAIGQMRRKHASVQGLARQLGTTWRCTWIKPVLEQAAADLEAGGGRRPDRVHQRYAAGNGRCPGSHSPESSPGCGDNRMAASRVLKTSEHKES